jgi:hypothetical protein
MIESIFFLKRRPKIDDEERALVRLENKVAADSGVYSFSRGIFISRIIYIVYKKIGKRTKTME